MREKKRIAGLLVALLVCMTTMAQGISMKFKNESLPSAFKKIEKATDYKFVFAYNDVSQYTVTGDVNKATINDVMVFLLKDKPLDYTVKGKIVNVTKQNRKPTNTRTRRVSGYVTDENGELVDGYVTDITYQPHINYEANSNGEIIPSVEEGENARVEAEKYRTENVIARWQNVIEGQSVEELEQ